MKRKKFLALALAGVMTAVTLTACAPLETLYDWFFGGGSSNASHGSEKSLVTESVAKGFDAEWLDNNKLNDKAKDALIPIT